jgi:hypothetical protein
MYIKNVTKKLDLSVIFSLHYYQPIHAPTAELSLWIIHKENGPEPTTRAQCG